MRRHSARVPTNISTPIWQCNICRNSFGDDRDTATRCEAAGPAVTLPAGTLLLRYVHPNYKGPGHFDLVPLTPTDRVTTKANSWTDKSGHHRDYTFQQPGAQTVRISDEVLSPLLPDHLHTCDNKPGHASSGVPTRCAAWAAAVFGLAQPGSPAATSSKAETVSWDSVGQWVNPLTEPVAAVLSALDCTLYKYRAQVAETNDLRNYELGLSGGNIPRAAAGLMLRDRTARSAAILDLQTRWLAGEPVTAPRPQLKSTSTRTASTLTKNLQALVAATGVPWKPRTSASEYANQLVRETLMTRTTADLSLFPGATVIAVAGVKGGVGKSTVAAALATRIATTGKNVTLVDLDVAGPSQHLLWNLGPVPTDTENLRLLATTTDVPGLKVFSSGQLADGLPRRWDDDTITQWIHFIGATLDTTGTDVVVLDLPAGLGRVDSLVTSSEQGINVSTVVHVTTAHPLALADVTRGLPNDMHARHRNVLVENMATVTGAADDGSQTRVRLFGYAGQVAELAAAHRVEFGGSLPWSADHLVLADSPELAHLADIASATA